MKALITGCTGQDGSYLSELLLSKGYEVHGVIRRASLPNTDRLEEFFPHDQKGFLHYGDLSEGIDHLLYDIKPDEVYNLGAMSHVKISFDVPEYTGQVNALGPLRILEGIRKLGLKTRFYQASSSEMFGTTPAPQREDSPFNPVSPYGIAKLYAYHTTRAYRNGYGLFAANGILFNHESERRGVNFVTKKIVKAAVRIKAGLQEKVRLGNLEARRDWGHSKDYVRAMWLILQHERPDDFVIATGENYSVLQFALEVFGSLDLDFYRHFEYDGSYLRPNEVPELCGDSAKARKVLGWEPEITFKELVKGMIEYERSQI